jgi:hypothetical protein
MPGVAALVDELREALGREMVDAAIKSGMAGEGGFWAREDGVEIGSKPRINPAREFPLSAIDIKPACVMCVHFRERLESPDGSRVRRTCARYGALPVQPCVDWRRACN